MSLEVLKDILTLDNILMMNVGMMAGTLIGAMPGLNVIFAIAILLPMTFGMESLAGMYLMLASYCGATFGGSITAILINTPGTPNAAATVFDGYPLAQKGRAGDALKTALIGSTFGGIFSCIALLFFAPKIAKIALHIASPEYFALCLFGLACVVGLSEGAMRYQGSSFVHLSLRRYPALHVWQQPAAGRLPPRHRDAGHLCCR